VTATFSLIPQLKKAVRIEGKSREVYSGGKERMHGVWNKGTFPTIPEERILYAYKT
jgi:hypothetical protein